MSKLLARPSSGLNISAVNNILSKKPADLLAPAPFPTHPFFQNTSEQDSDLSRTVQKRGSTDSGTSTGDTPSPTLQHLFGKYIPATPRGLDRLLQKPAGFEAASKNIFGAAGTAAAVSEA